MINHFLNNVLSIPLLALVLRVVNKVTEGQGLPFEKVLTSMLSNPAGKAYASGNRPPRGLYPGGPLKKRPDTLAEIETASEQSLVTWSVRSVKLFSWPLPQIPELAQSVVDGRYVLSMFVRVKGRKTRWNGQDNIEGVAAMKTQEQVSHWSNAKGVLSHGTKPNADTSPGNLRNRGPSTSRLWGGNLSC